MAVDITITGAGGEYMEDVTVVEWRVAEGDRVARGDIVAVVETAKAATDIESPADGVLDRIMVPAGSDAAVGTVLGRIRSSDSAAAGSSADTPSASLAQPGSPPDEAPTPRPARRPEAARRRRDGRPAVSPRARRLAAREGLDLSHVTGTGPHGRIKRRDVEAAVRASGGSAKAAAAAPARGPAGTPPAAERPAMPMQAAGLRLVPSPSAVPDALPAPVVFLHGFGADHMVWRALTPALDPWINAVSVDLPGHGQSALGRDNTVPDLAGSVARALEVAGQADCHLVAHSLGAGVALALIGSGEVAARSLTLIAPAGLGPEIDGDFLAAFTRADGLEALEAALSALFAPGAGPPEGFAKAVHRRRADPALREGQAGLAAALFPGGRQSYDGRMALAAYTGPVRVIWGLADGVIPPSHADGLPPAAALHRLPGVGHMPHVEAPGLVARLVSQTVRSAR